MVARICEGHTWRCNHVASRTSRPAATWHGDVLESVFGRTCPGRLLTANFVGPIGVLYRMKMPNVRITFEAWNPSDLAEIRFQPFVLKHDTQSCHVACRRREYSAPTYSFHSSILVPGAHITV